jgi:NDP-sugar pyrophosphorylase family protein
MQQKTLDLRKIMELDGLHQKDQLPLEDFRNLIGKPLILRIQSILDNNNVPKDSPLVHGHVADGALIEGRVFIAEGASVESTALIRGPSYIGPGTEVRHGAYIRGNTYVGQDCVVGHATEVKGSVFLDGAKAGHFAYVGDSILGPRVNLGAGTKLANLKLNQKDVRIQDPETKEWILTGLKKLGALIGSEVQVGCNAVLSPGTLLLPGALIAPCAHIMGTKGRGLHRS